MFQIECEHCNATAFIGSDQNQTEAAKAFIELHLEECYEPIRRAFIQPSDDDGREP